MSQQRKRARRPPPRPRAAVPPAAVPPAAEPVRLVIPEGLSPWLRPDPPRSPLAPPVQLLGERDAAASPDVPVSAAPVGAVEAYIDRNAPEVVGMTYWFDPGSAPVTQSVRIRVTGQRVGAESPFGPGDQFVHEQTLEGVLGGSGPIAVTTKIRDVTPGEWAVDAAVLSVRPSGPGADGPEGWPRPESVLPIYPARWSWRHWRPAPEPAATVTTRLAPLVATPGVLIGSWAFAVALGIVLGLVIQSVVISAQGLALTHVLTVSALSILAGAIGAKLWFMGLHRHEHRREGWCVQGMIAGIVVVAPALLVALQVPVGAYLDATAPGVMVGLATGRIGCFFTGCCAGRPTGSRWAVWSSNRSVGARRVPTQLLESALAFSVGLVVLVAVLRAGPRHGMLFIAALAVYTLIRQGLLLFREEPRRSRLGAPLVAAIAALALGTDLIALVLA